MPPVLTSILSDQASWVRLFYKNQESAIVALQKFRRKKKTCFMCSNIEARQTLWSNEVVCRILHEVEAIPWQRYKSHPYKVPWRTWLRIHSIAVGLAIAHQAEKYWECLNNRFNISLMEFLICILTNYCYCTTLCRYIQLICHVGSFKNRT